MVLIQSFSEHEHSIPTLSPDSARLGSSLWLWIWVLGVEIGPQGHRDLTLVKMTFLATFELVPGWQILNFCGLFLISFAPMEKKEEFGNTFFFLSTELFLFLYLRQGLM